MAHNRTSFRRILTRCLALFAMFCIYGFGIIGGSALVLGASSTSALAHGSGHGGGGGGHGFGGGGHGFGGHGFGGHGFRGGGFRGAGFGFGLGVYPYGYYGGYYPYYEDEGVCYVVRQRVKTRHGWRIRRVSVCE